MNKTSYNNIPYQSLPVPFTYLPHLAGLGRLFGMETADPEQCRVLEIGCAEASNIIPMAWHLPRSEFVGIDLSEVQINKGKQLIESLALENIMLHVQDVTTLRDNHPFSEIKESSTERKSSDKDGYKKFDYILIHGVFSWVSTETQQTILATAKSLLAESGLIYISYNTYPGWHAQMVLRDAMLLYSSKYREPEQKRAKVSEAIKYLKNFFKAADNEFSAYNIKRLATLENNSSRYLYHEFLETHNHPLYVKDFIKKASHEGLQYVSDALLAFDSPLLLGEKRNAYISDKQDRSERLQYMDFMLNQRFRRSLLCHKRSSLRDEFAPEHMTKLAFRGCFSSKRKVNLSNDKPCKFYQGDDNKTFMTLAHPVSKAAAQILSERYPASIMYMDLLQVSCQRVIDNNGLDSNHLHSDSLNHVKKIELFYHEFYLLFINDWLALDIKAHQCVEIDWNKPLFITNLCLQYACQTGFLPSFLLKAIDVDDVEIQILKLLRKGMSKRDVLDKMVSLQVCIPHSSKNSPQSNISSRGMLRKLSMSLYREKYRKKYWEKHRKRIIKEKASQFIDVLHKHQMLNNSDQSLF